MSLSNWGPHDAAPRGCLLPGLAAAARPRRPAHAPRTPRKRPALGSGLRVYGFRPVPAVEFEVCGLLFQWGLGSRVRVAPVVLRTPDGHKYLTSLQ